MNKRLGLLSLFGITTLVLAMVGAITALAAPSPFVTGTVTLNKAWYTIGSPAVVTVTDADANITVPATETKTLAANGTLGTQLVTLTIVAGQRVASPKILLAGQTCPSGTVDTNLAVSVFGDGSIGVILVTNGAPIAGGAQPVCYNKIKIDTVLVAVKSGLDSATYGAGVGTLLATETGVDTGIFQVTITLTEAASSSTAKTLKTTNGDTIIAEYTDTTPASGASLKVTSLGSNVETLKPAFSNLVPANGFSTQASQVTFSGTVNDIGGSGVDINTIALVLDGVPNAPMTITGNSGAASVTFSVTLPSGAVGNHAWYVTAKDVAGNSGRSDSNAPVFGDQDHTFTVNSPTPTPTATPIPGVAPWGLAAMAVLMMVVLLWRVRGRDSL